MYESKLIQSTILLQIILLTQGSDITGFTDFEVDYKINWPGKSTPDFLESQTNAEPYFITTANNEKYQCLIPQASPEESDYIEQFKGVDPVEVLQSLFDRNSCSFRLESYWTYEVCHGRYVRQYHEEREGKKVKTQEYYLGTFDKDTYFTTKMLQAGPAKAEIPVKTIQGIKMPYAEIKMTGGTVCDLNNKPRTIKLVYICYPHGKHEIQSLEEISSCEYEAIILSPLLCSHPDYRPRGAGENEINCLPVDNAPKKPRSLIALEAESLKLRHQKVTDAKPQKVHTIFHVDQGQDGEARVRVEIRPVDVLDKHNIDESGNLLPDQGIGQSDISPVQNFLSGQNCLNGGNGWWKYEFCYGKSVVQYHVERDGSKTTVDLGKFDKAKHIEWIEAHPNKRPKPLAERKQLSHFYGDGSVCDKTGKLRQTEVRLKCIENPTASPSSVSLFLLEPKTCEYILGVESMLICDILEYADSDGLISEEAMLRFSELKSSMEEATTKKDDDLDVGMANGDE